MLRTFGAETSLFTKSGTQQVLAPSASSPSDGTYQIAWEVDQGSTPSVDNLSMSVASGNAIVSYSGLASPDIVGYLLSYEGVDNNGQIYAHVFTSGSGPGALFTGQTTDQAAIAVSSSAIGLAYNVSFQKIGFTTSSVSNGTHTTFATLADPPVKRVSQPDVAALSNGAFAVVWDEDFTISGSAIEEGEVALELFDVNAQPIGSSKAVGYATGNSIGFNTLNPAITAFRDGGFVVTYTLPESLRGTATDVYGVIYDNNGNAQGDPFLLNTTTTGSQSQTSVATTASGFVAAWFDGSNSSIKAQQFDRTGQKIGGEVTVSATAGAQSPAVAVDNEGRVEIAYVTSGGIAARTLFSGSMPRDFTGDYNSDILFRNGAGTTYLWAMSNMTVLAGGTTSTQVGVNWQIKGLADFNGDGNTDILWSYNNAANAADPLNGISYITFQQGSAATSGAVVQQLSSDWQVAGTGDFNADGDADVLYRNANSGATYIDFMNGATITSASGFTAQSLDASSHWQVAAVADFDGDGHADILWRYDNPANPSDGLNGALYEWQMNGTAIVSQGLLSQQPGSDHWSVAGTGDFNGDGQADILFRYNNAANASDSLNGFTFIDFMNGAHVSLGTPTQWQVDNSWTIASIGDFNGDGYSDILFQQTSTGNTYIWQMQYQNVMNGGFTSDQSGLGWTVQNGVLTN